MGNIRRGGQREGDERPSAELSGHDQQMGGQGERNERDSWRDGGDKAEIEERGRDAEQKRGDWPAFKKKMKDENGRAAMWRNKGSGRADADRGQDDKVFT